MVKFRLARLPPARRVDVRLPHIVAHTSNFDDDDRSCPTISSPQHPSSHIRAYGASSGRVVARHVLVMRKASASRVVLLAFRECSGRLTSRMHRSMKAVRTQGRCNTAEMAAYHRMLPCGLSKLITSSRARLTGLYMCQ